jgi:hypothetical protein
MTAAEDTAAATAEAIIAAFKVRRVRFMGNFLGSS